MRYLALACDYDGTIAQDGQVADSTIAALVRLHHTGRKLILVTGRELDDLRRVFTRLDVFDRVVAENGALIYTPATQEEKILGERPPEDFIRELLRRGVGPTSVGRVIVATWEPHETTVLETIRDFGLEFQVVFNKGAVMVLPSGINKASGLSATLAEMGLSPHNTVGVGDAENDHAFLSLCECAVAVANALPSVQEKTDWVTAGDHGAGVEELIERIISTDLQDMEERLARYHIILGHDAAGHVLSLNPYGTNVLLAGSSQGGKTTLATGLIERIIDQHYQVCVIDPEGDYAELDNFIVLGDGNRPPSIGESIELLADPEQNVVLNLLGIRLEHRPAFFAELYPRLQELRTRTGHPHWIIVDETHHLLPSDWQSARLTLSQDTYGVMLIMVEPQHTSPAVLSIVDTAIAIGAAPEKTIQQLCAVLGQEPPPLEPVTLAQGEALLYAPRRHSQPVWFRSLPPAGQRRRHHRKYAEGEIPPESSFYFRGPQGKLNLRAQNLMMFIQLAEGVDDETWLYHLQRGDYSDWFRTVIRDDALASEAAQAEQGEASVHDSRAQILRAIEQRYTAPA
ncbi:MAG: HAD-IIB family hydrolase [Candidatus Tectimicrobiota bacterium]